MCKITVSLRKRSFKPTSESFVARESLNATVNSISSILQENSSVVVSKENQKKIRRLISQMYGYASGEQSVSINTKNTQVKIMKKHVAKQS